VNRIFEGTNEINQLVITGFLLKRARSGHLLLIPAIKKLMDEVLAGTRNENEEGDFAEERKFVATAKKIGFFAAGVATQKYMQTIQEEQKSWRPSPTWRSRRTQWSPRCCVRGRLSCEMLQLPAPSRLPRLAFT